MIGLPSKNKACHLLDETGFPVCIITLDSLISAQLLSHSPPHSPATGNLPLFPGWTSRFHVSLSILRLVSWPEMLYF